MNSVSVERQGGKKKRLNIFQDKQKDFWWEHFTVNKTFPWEVNCYLGLYFEALCEYLQQSQIRTSFSKNSKPTNPLQTVASFPRDRLLIQKQ